MTSYHENLVNQLVVEERARVANSSIKGVFEALAISSNTQEEEEPTLESGAKKMPRASTRPGTEGRQETI